MLTEEQIKEQSFTPEQIEVVNKVYSAKEAELKGLANKNADGIFNGAAAELATLTGISKGEKEKYSVYFKRLGTEWLPEASKSKIEAAELKVAEAEEKFKNHKGDETLKLELEKAKDEVSKIPDLLAAKDTAWKTKYDELETTYTTTKLKRSITDAMPKFDDNANEFEVQAKQKNAIDRIQTDYELSYDENDNLIGTKDYQKFLVSDLLKNDAELKDLILIDSGEGGGGSGKKPSGKTLNLPEGIAKGAAQQIIATYIKDVDGIDQLDDKYSERFVELCKENKVL